MKEICVNKVFCIRDDKNKTELFRIISVDDTNEFIHTVSLETQVSMPKVMKVKKIINLIESGFIIDADDPWILIIEENSIPAEYKKIRHERWQIVDYIWNENRKRVLDKRMRVALFEEASHKYQTYPNAVRRVLSRFWQRGMTPNTLLPDYDKRGSHGSDTDNKRGRPKKYYAADAEQCGINITDNIKEKIRETITSYYRTRSNPSVKDTYQEMLKKYFSDPIYRDGQIQKLIWSEDRIPTYHQFYYWFNKLTNKKKDIISRSGEREFLLKHRELIGDTSREAFGPGGKYQIDATIADVYVVSSFNREYVIGRPVLYIVMDVFSHLITGMYVGIEGPSWIGAMMALDNVVADKVEFCKKFEINITKEQWPSSLLPERILADRGEFEGYGPEAMIQNLNIIIENTPPYRADLKGLVERNFRTTNERIRKRTPGAVRKAIRERGERDYRLDAVLNLEEFTKIIIHEIIRHNNSIINGYEKSIFEINNKVKPIPTEIWKWGCDNRRCGFRVYDREFIRMCLLPRGKASITREGISFHGMFYSCDEAIKEGWFIDAGRTSVTVAYDPRSLDYIYIPDTKGKSYIKCFLLDKSKNFRNKAWDDIRMVRQYLAEEKKLIENREIQQSIDTDSEIDRIISNAMKLTKSQHQDSDNSSRIRNMRETKAVEKELLRTVEQFNNVAEDNNKDYSREKQSSDNKKEQNGLENREYQRRLETLKKKRSEIRDRKDK